MIKLKKVLNIKKCFSVFFFFFLFDNSNLGEVYTTPINNDYRPFNVYKEQQNKQKQNKKKGIFKVTFFFFFFFVLLYNLSPHYYIEQLIKIRNLRC
jgi:hypothetical protein